VVTIKEIAEKAEVGIATVSRVLNGSPLVRDETRERVLDVVKRLGYRPNKMARMLVKGDYSDSTIGVLMPEVTHQFFFEVVGGIYRALKAQDFNLMIFNMGMKREQVFEHIAQERLAGLLIMGSPPLSTEEKDLLQLHGSRYLYLDYHEPEENCIYYDNAAGGREAARYLVSRGCRSIAFVGGPAHTQQQQERKHGFDAELAEAGVPPSSEHATEIDEEQSCRLSRRLFEDRTLDGIFYFCDTVAYGGLRARAELSASVRIVGYDDILPSRYLGLSTVRQPSAELGSEGARAILRIVRAPAPPADHPTIQRCIRPRLIDRGS